ncbi:MAG: S-layer homology domain-containing protein, partial [bacterium]
MGKRVARLPRRRLSFACVLLLTALLLLLGGAGTAWAFSDVPPDRPDYRAITWLEAKGAVEGFPDGTFRPDATAIRAEFVKM